MKEKIGNILRKAFGAGIFCAVIGMCLGSFNHEPSIIDLLSTFGLLFICFFIVMIPFAILTEI